MSNISFLSVDLQYDFSREGGAAYVSGKSVTFVREILLPHFERTGLKTSEIISDYRQPRPGDPRDMCHPGGWGYLSEIPSDLRKGKQWVKCMNSPLWTRKEVGKAGKDPSIPYQDPARFDRWLSGNIGGPSESEFVALFGLALDACVLCTAQELTFRGYDVRIIREATDTRTGSVAEKDRMLSNPPITYWADPIGWKEIINALDGD